MNTHQSKDNSFPRLLTERLWVLGNYFFNLYLVKGEQGSALIEVGVSGVIDQVVEQLTGLNIRPTFLVVTHPHADHITGLQALKERFPDALVILGHGAGEFLTHPKSAELIVAEDRHMSQFLTTHGYPHKRPPIQDLPTLHHCLVAHDRDEIDLGDVSLRFLSVEGHSPGSIAVYVPELSALMPADSLGFHFPGRAILPLFFTSYPAYMEVLTRLENLHLSMLGMPHQGPLQGAEIPRIFAQARSSAQALREEILADPRPSEELAQELFSRYYRDELTLYSPANILTCMRLIVRRAREDGRK